jgi:cell division protein YceG involved in septum cleavage
MLAPVNDRTTEIRVDVASGSSLWRIATQLEDAGVVRSARALVLLARWRATP